jgi:hypothetical protein
VAGRRQGPGRAGGPRPRGRLSGTPRLPLLLGSTPQRIRDGPRPRGGEAPAVGVGTWAAPSARLALGAAVGPMRRGRPGPGQSPARPHCRFLFKYLRRRTWCPLAPSQAHSLSLSLSLSLSRGTSSSLEAAVASGGHALWFGESAR